MPAVGTVQHKGLIQKFENFDKINGACVHFDKLIVGFIERLARVN